MKLEGILEKYNVGGELTVDQPNYKIHDNTYLKNLTVSNVILKAGKETYKHSHPINDEIYIYHSGKGYMTVGKDKLDVGPGTIVLVNGKKEHQTFNTGNEDMQFTMVFDNIGKTPEDMKEEN